MRSSTRLRFINESSFPRSRPPCTRCCAALRVALDTGSSTAASSAHLRPPPCTDGPHTPRRSSGTSRRFRRDQRPRPRTSFISDTTVACGERDPRVARARKVLQSSAVVQSCSRRARLQSSPIRRPTALRRACRSARGALRGAPLPSPPSPTPSWRWRPS